MYSIQKLDDPFEKNDYKDMLKTFKQNYDEMPFQDFIKLYDSFNYSMQLLKIKEYEKLGGKLEDIINE